MTPKFKIKNGQIKITHAGLVAQIMDYLHKARVFAYSNLQGVSKYDFTKNDEGIVDIAGTTDNGRSFYIEVKVGTDILKPAQKVFLFEAQKRKALIYVARDFTKFLEWWELYGKG